MLTIFPVKNRSYYLDIAKNDDYYLDGGEPPGIWLGRGAIHLGIAGQVRSEDYYLLLDGYSPDKQPLVQNPGDEERRTAWDLTFSAPKSISLVWASADIGLRREIEDAQHSAVVKAIDFLERHAAITRRGKQSKTSEKTAGLVVAAFAHCTSRAQDFQLHHHAVVCNVAPRFDDTWGSLESRRLYHWQMAAGSIYRSELASQMRELGFETEQDGKSFHLKGVDKSLCDYFSKRALAIEESLKSTGSSSSASRAGDRAKLITRKHKSLVDRATLLDQWQTELSLRGFDHTQIQSMRFQQSETVQNQDFNDRVLAELTETRSIFREQDLFEYVARVSIAFGLGATQVEKCVSTLLRHPDLVHLPTNRPLSRYFTTQHILEVEQSMIESAMALASRSHYRFSNEEIKIATLETEEHLGFKFDDEQREAIVATLGSGDFTVTQGSAGAGKTTLLSVIHHIYEKSGLSVVGACVTKKAADNLQRESGINSRTVASLLRSIEKESAPNPLRKIDTLVIDEASQLSSATLQQLLGAAESVNCKVILTGEDLQLDAIEHGGALRYLSRPEVIGATRIQTIRRQREAWAREAVAAFRDGRAEVAIKLLSDHNLIHWSKDSASTRSQLIDSWREHQRENPNKASLIIAQRWKDVQEINSEVRGVLQDMGKVGTENIELNCFVADRPMKFTFSSGDRIRFCHNEYRDLKVSNGTTGTIKSITRVKDADTRLVILTDESRSLEFNVSDYGNEHGQAYLATAYASTVYSSQGMTIDGDTFVLYSSGMDRANTYVAASRHKDHCHIFCNQKEIDGISGVLDSGVAGTLESRLNTLAKYMSQDKYKTLAIEHFPSLQLSKKPLEVERYITPEPIIHPRYERELEV